MSRIRSLPWPWIVVAVVCVVALIVAIVFVRRFNAIGAIDAVPPARDATPWTPGIRATITAAEVTIQRTFLQPSFQIDPDQSLDARLPAGSFEARIEVAFSPGATREAYLGAEIRNVSFILYRGDELVQSSYAGDEGKVVFSIAPVNLRGSGETLTYEVTSDGAATASFRAVWQSLDATFPEILPVVDDPWRDDAALQGLALSQRLNCAACHRSFDDSLQTLLEEAPAPRLDSIGARVQPKWLRDWLDDPHALDENSRMPHLLNVTEVTAEERDDLVAFLISLEGPGHAQFEANTAEELQLGRMLYHTVGCVPCHGPLESALNLFGGPLRSGFLAGQYEPLDGLTGKTTHAALATYLRNPLPVHPGGEMPSMSLTTSEAAAIAAYLLVDDGGSLATGEEVSIPPDPAGIARGEASFVARRCSICHDTGLAQVDEATTPLAAPLESLAPGLDRGSEGCLAAAPSVGLPDYQLTDGDRGSLIAFLRSIPERRSVDTPAERLLLTTRRLRCTSCHAFGTEEGPEPGLRRFFRVEPHGDFGDESRFPPTLNDVAMRLTTSGLAEALLDGPNWRPALSTRMPRFGPINVEALPRDLAVAAGSAPGPSAPSVVTPETFSIGEFLVGAMGFDCVRCHAMDDHPSSEPPGSNLALIVRRLRYDHFQQIILDPQRVIPDTRMPGYFVAGRSGFTEHFEGQADDQIAAMWAYLWSVPVASTPDKGDPADMMLPPADAQGANPGR